MSFFGKDRVEGETFTQYLARTENNSNQNQVKANYEAKLGERLNGINQSPETNGNEKLQKLENEYNPVKNPDNPNFDTEYSDKMKMLSEGKSIEEIFGDEIKEKYTELGTPHYKLKDGSIIIDSTHAFDRRLKIKTGSLADFFNPKNWVKSKNPGQGNYYIDKPNGYREGYDFKGNFKCQFIGNSISRIDEVEKLIEKTLGKTKDKTSLYRELESAGIFPGKDDYFTIKQKLENFIKNR